MCIRDNLRGFGVATAGWVSRTSGNKMCIRDSPYTKALVASRPIPDPEQSRKHYVISGDVPDPSDPPSGCYFHTRCDYAQDVCRHERPQLRKVGPDHIVACHLVN